MSGKKIHNTKVEAIDAIKQLIDRLYELEEECGASLAENDVKGGSWYIAYYYDDEKNVKKVYHYG